MIRWTGLAPWKFEFPFPGSLTSTQPVKPTAAGRRVNNLKRFCGLEPGSQFQNLVLTVLYVPSLLDSGTARYRKPETRDPKPNETRNPRPETRNGEHSYMGPLGTGWTTETLIVRQW